MSKIIIADALTDEVLDRLHHEDVLDNFHERIKPSWEETFEFTAFADRSYARHILNRNRIIIPDEDGSWRELIISFVDKYKDGMDNINVVEVEAYGWYQDLVGSKIIYPGTTASQTAESHAREILEGIDVEIGEVAYTGLRKITRGVHTDPFSALKSLANEFNLELDFYVKIERGKIVRYVSLVERIGEWNGRHIEFGVDLQSISRKEDSDELVTALLVLGPQNEDGKRLEVLVEDEEARQRWGRNGNHIIDTYEPETENQDITEERLRTLGRMELDKRINTLVTWEADITDLEHVPGLENKKIRFGDTVRIKDTTFNPPIFVDARIFRQKRDIFVPSDKSVELGDFTEYTVEEVRSNWEKLRDELEKKIREAEERAKWRASHGSKIVAIMPLSSQKSGIDSQYNEIIDNPDLSSTLRGQLTVAKVSYDGSYDSLMTTVEAKDKLDNPSETDVEEVYGLLGSYESELANISELLEKATESISKNYTDDHIDEVNRELDEASRRIDEARDDIDRARSDLDTAQEELDQTKIDLEDSRDRLRGAEDNLRETRDDLSKLESDLREAENSLRDKVDFVDYNEKITDITQDMASKVDGEWVDGRLRVEIDGESELIYVKEDIDGMFENTVSKTKYETDQQGIVERFESAESRIYQNEQAIGGMVKQIDYNADQERLEERLIEWERTADGFNQSVSRLQTDFDNLEIGGRNYALASDKKVGYQSNARFAYDVSNEITEFPKTQFAISFDMKYTGIHPVSRVEIYFYNGKFLSYAGGNDSGNRENTPIGGLKNNGDWARYSGTLYTVDDIGDENDITIVVRVRTTGSPTFSSEVEVKNMKVEKGNRATDWSPAPEDQISYTETRIQQLADEIALEYIKDDDLIAGIRIGDPNPINGANVEITGDTAIYGRLLAPDATFIKISTEEMYAIDAEIENSKIIGTLDANEALFQKGKFEEAHLIKAKIEEADIIDADIQNATITGELNGVGGTFTGQLDGVDGTFTGKMTAGEIEGSTIRGSDIYGSYFETTGNRGKISISGDRFSSSVERSLDRTIAYIESGEMRFSEETGLNINKETNLNVDGLYLTNLNSFSHTNYNINRIEFGQDASIEVLSGSNLDIHASTVRFSDYVEISGELSVGGGITADRLATTDGASLDTSGSYTYLRPAGNSNHSIRFTNSSGYIAFLVNGEVTHAFRTDGTKIGGTIDVDGERYGMSPIDSPQILLSVLLTDVEIRAGQKTEIQLNAEFAKAIKNMAVFPSQPVRITKGDGRFSVTAEEDLTVDFMVYGERTGYEGTFWLDTEEDNIVWN